MEKPQLDIEERFGRIELAITTIITVLTQIGISKEEAKKIDEILGAE